MKWGLDGFAGWRRAGLVCLLVAVARASGQQPPPDGTWTTNAEVRVTSAVTDLSLGAIQGVAVRDGKVYPYGDLPRAGAHLGVIREYTEALEPTGRVIWLTRDGKPLVGHPTGLTWNDRWGTFLGDTVKSADPTRTRAVIYRIDWPRALADGTLDHAIIDVIDDDAAVNGCRPEFVSLQGRTLLATADYGDIRPEIRLYDPAALLRAHRSSEPGVVVHRVICGPFNQNLHWDAATGHLTCIQNVIAGRGWRLDVLDLPRAVVDGRSEGPGVRVRQLTFPAHDELEGFWPLEENHGLFAVSRWRDNLFRASFAPTGPRITNPAAPVPPPRPAPAAAAPGRGR